jgi:hypothetical protein
MTQNQNPKHVLLIDYIRFLRVRVLVVISLHFMIRLRRISSRKHEIYIVFFRVFVLS